MAEKTAAELGLSVGFILPVPSQLTCQMIMWIQAGDLHAVYYSRCGKCRQEMRRVLKPEGKILFCEHGLAPDESVSKWQARIDPLWGKLAGGCHLNRDIPKLIRSAGLTIETMDEMYLPSTPKFAGYNYWGSCVSKRFLYF